MATPQGSSHVDTQLDLAATVQEMQGQIATLHQAVMQMTSCQPNGDTTDRSIATTSAVEVQGEPLSQLPRVQANMVASPSTPVGHLDQTVVSFPVSMGSLVDPKLKSKIWSNQYIELDLLLSPPKETVTLTLDQSSAIRFAIDEKATKKIDSIHQWTSAFMIYMAVYIEAHINEAPSLLQYMKNIRNMAASIKNGPWLRYDRDFRKNRAVANHPWHAKHQDKIAQAQCPDSNIQRYLSVMSYAHKIITGAARLCPSSGDVRAPITK